MPFDCTACDLADQVVEVVKTGVIASSGASFAVSFFMKFAKSLLWEMINTLQLYVYYPLFKV